MRTLVHLRDINGFGVQVMRARSSENWRSQLTLPAISLVVCSVAR